MASKATISVTQGQLLKETSLLKPYPNNARTHTKEQINKVANSIIKFGWTNPILIGKDNVIIAGHCRLLAAKKMKLESVPCIDLSHMSKDEARAYVIADNRLALDAGWDNDMLKLELSELDELGFDLDVIGFSKDELDAILNDNEIAEGLIGDDDVPIDVDTRCKLGDVWVLGEHRLVCGDSISIDAVESLVGNHKVDLIFTDPPYNVGFNGRSGNFDVIKNDSLTEDEFNGFIQGFASIVTTLECPIYYIWCNWKFYNILHISLPFKACIVWAKNVFGLGNGYRHQHEFCLFNGAIDESIKNESDLWEVAKDVAHVHPTQKPIELAIRALKNHKKAKNILDLFGGSGSTLIACEKLKRKCFMMELDPKYCDVILKRWEDFTGKIATLETVNG